MWLFPQAPRDLGASRPTRDLTIPRELRSICADIARATASSFDLKYAPLLVVYVVSHPR
jgi:hypothetical protein